MVFSQIEEMNSKFRIFRWHPHSPQNYDDPYQLVFLKLDKLSTEPLMTTVAVVVFAGLTNVRDRQTDMS